MIMGVQLQDADGNVVEEFMGPPHLAMAFALRFMHRHGMDPEGFSNTAVGEWMPQDGSIHFWEFDEAPTYVEQADELMERLKLQMDELAGYDYTTNDKYR